MSAAPFIRPALAALLGLSAAVHASRFAGFAGDLGRPEVAELYAGELMNDSTGIFSVEVVAGEHDNGWGLWYRAAGFEEIHRSAQPLDATGGEGFEDWRAVWPPPLGTGVETLVVAHARLNSDQPPGFPGPHPFLYELNGGTVAFAHNGTVRAAPGGTAGIGRVAEEMRVFDRLPVFAGREHAAWGASPYKVDSESYFALMFRNLLLRETYWPTTTEGGLDAGWCIGSVAQQVLGASARNYTSANCIVALGDSLYAYRDVTDEADDYHSVCVSWPGAPAARFVTLLLDDDHALPAGYGRLPNRHIARAGLDGGRPESFSARVVMPAIPPLERFLEVQVGGRAGEEPPPRALGTCPDGSFVALWAEADGSGPRLVIRRFDALGLAHEKPATLLARSGAEAILDLQLALPGGDPGAASFAGRLAWRERWPGGTQRLVTAELFLERVGGAPVLGALEVLADPGAAASLLRLAAVDERTWLLGRLEDGRVRLRFADGAARREQLVDGGARFDLATLAGAYAVLQPSAGRVLVLDAVRPGHRAAVRMPSAALERFDASPLASGGFLAAAFSPQDGRIAVRRFDAPTLVAPETLLDTLDASAVWWTPALEAPVPGQVQPLLRADSAGGFHLVFSDGGELSHQSYGPADASGEIVPERAGRLNRSEFRAGGERGQRAVLSETFVDEAVTASLPEAFRRRLFVLWPAGGGNAGELKARILPWIAGEFAAPRPPVVPDPVPRPAACALAAAPNPFRATTRLRLELQAPAEGWLRIYNLRGQRVATVHEGRFPAGFSDWSFDGGRLASGVYIAAGRFDKGRAVAGKLLRVK